MINTFYFSKEEVKKALIWYANRKESNIQIPENISFIGFLDDSENNVDVSLIQVFYAID
ncbi:hypothetical protein Elgi_38080 [Paenibacillus elgii]|nr:hypothetical protein Elgi_38080 [Paenibacillus elgii]